MAIGDDELASAAENAMTKLAFRFLPQTVSVPNWKAVFCWRNPTRRQGRFAELAPGKARRQGRSIPL